MVSYTVIMKSTFLFRGLILGLVGDAPNDLTELTHYNANMSV